MQTLKALQHLNTQCIMGGMSMVWDTPKNMFLVIGQFGDVCYLDVETADEVGYSLRIETVLHGVQYRYHEYGDVCGSPMRWIGPSDYQTKYPQKGDEQIAVVL